MPVMRKTFVPIRNRHYSGFTMNLICPACQWSSSSPPKRVVVTGACPSCSGQVWLEEPVESKVMPGLVAMSFEPGSNLAQRLVAFHRDTSLEGVLQEQEVPQEVAQESRDLLSAAILPAPPVVEHKMPVLPVFLSCPICRVLVLKMTMNKVTITTMI